MLSSCSFNESDLRSNYEIDVKLGKFGPFLKYVSSVFSLELRTYLINLFILPEIKLLSHNKMSCSMMRLTTSKFVDF